MQRLIPSCCLKIMNTRKDKLIGKRWLATWVCLTWIVLAVTTVPAATPQWPQFRGPTKAEWEAEVTRMYDGFKEGEKGLKSAVFAVPAGGSGDVTNKVAWTDSRGVPEVPSPLFYQGRL